VSKYELDRGELDIEKLRREKEKERTEANKNVKAELDKEIEEKKVHDVQATEKKIEDLAKLKEKQDRERKQMVKKN
jgi:hypothetical protein